MTNPFDASLIYAEPISAETLASQASKVEDLMQRPTALANAKLHAENAMKRMEMTCNRTAWGTVSCEPRPPTPEETAELMARLEPDIREKLIGEARAVAEQRTLLARMEEAHQHYLADMEAVQAEEAQREALAQEWAEFVAYDVATQEERFLAWRAARGAST